VAVEGVKGSGGNGEIVEGRVLGELLLNQIEKFGTRAERNHRGNLFQEIALFVGVCGDHRCDLNVLIELLAGESRNKKLVRTGRKLGAGMDLLRCAQLVERDSFATNGSYSAFSFAASASRRCLPPPSTIFAG
jgi:hypothetical protein